MAEHETAQQELRASEMRQKHKSIPCLKIILLRIETETHAQACAHPALRKGMIEWRNPWLSRRGSEITEPPNRKGSQQPFSLELVCYRRNEGPERQYLAWPGEYHTLDSRLLSLNFKHISSSRLPRKPPAQKADQGQYGIILPGLCFQKHPISLPCLEHAT